MHARIRTSTGAHNELTAYMAERLDGNTSAENRQAGIDRFNTPGCGFAYLLSTRAGGMGIKGLMGFLNDHAPRGVKETKMESMTGRKIAIDASMCLYQFLVAVRQGEAQSTLSNAAGDVTSHIQGFLNRTIRMLECGIKPVYVFDGKPPALKGGELRVPGLADAVPLDRPLIEGRGHLRGRCDGEKNVRVRGAGCVGFRIEARADAGSRQPISQLVVVG